MKIGFIGCGRMGSALLEGFLRAGLCAAHEIAVHDPADGTAESLCRRYGFTRCKTNATLAKASDTVFLCVKPKDAAAALAEARRNLPGRLLVSIVAGMPVDALARIAGAGCRVIRAMPNTPAMVGRGMTAFARGPGATEKDADLAERFFASVGRVREVPEPLLDAVTGLSGSGPAFVYAAIEAMADGGVMAGLPRDLALEMAAQTVVGAAEMVLQTGEHPGRLKDAVASPAGTTIAGLHVLEKAAFRGALVEAVRVAATRSAELSKG